MDVNAIEQQYMALPAKVRSSYEVNLKTRGTISIACLFYVAFWFSAFLADLKASDPTFYLLVTGIAVFAVFTILNLYGYGLYLEIHHGFRKNARHIRANYEVYNQNRLNAERLAWWTTHVVKK